MVKVFTVKFIKLPKKFKEFSETNKVYSLGNVSQIYFEATSKYPELANKQIKLEVNDSLENQYYAIDVSIHLNLSLADLIVEQINQTIAKTEDGERLIAVKKRITAAFKAEIRPLNRQEFTAGTVSKVKKLSQNTQVTEPMVPETPADEVKVSTEIAVAALGEIDEVTDEIKASSDVASIIEVAGDLAARDESENPVMSHIFNESEEREMHANALDILLPTTEEAFNILDFKAIKKLKALKEDVTLKMGELDPIVTTDLEMLLFEIEGCEKAISEKVSQNLTNKFNKRISEAHAAGDEYKKNIELELDTKFDIKVKSLESEIQQSLEAQKQVLQEKHKKELESLEVTQEARQVEWLTMRKRNLDSEYKHELFQRCKDEFERIEKTIMNDMKNTKHEFDLVLFEDTSPQIESLLNKRTKIMNQTSQLSTPILKISEENGIVNDALGYLSSEDISASTALTNDERVTDVVSSLLEKKLDEMQEINKRSSDEYENLIAGLTVKTNDLELKLENSTNQLTEQVPYIGVGFKLLLGVSVVAMLFIGFFAYFQIQNVQEFNGQLLSQNQALESQLKEMDTSDLVVGEQGRLTFNDYLTNGDYLLAAIHYPTESETLVRHLFEREDADNLRLVLEFATETYGWLNVAILEEDHYVIIQEFENLLPREQAQLTIRQQNAVSLAYEELNYDYLKPQVDDETNQIISSDSHGG